MAFSKTNIFCYIPQFNKSEYTRLTKSYFKELLELKNSDVIIGTRHICNLQVFLACEFQPPKFFRSCFNVFINIVYQNLLSYSVPKF